MVHTVVIFGASGDLTSRKLIPALYSLHVKGYLPAQTRIVGMARSPFSDEAWRASLEETTRKHAGDFDAAKWAEFAATASLHAAQQQARELGVDPPWDCERARTPEGYYQVRGGIPYAIAKSLAAAPFADVLWMETKTADLADAREFAEAVHAVYPDKMLAYNLSPSFNWDTTGMSDEQMRAFARTKTPGEVCRRGLWSWSRHPNYLGEMGFWWGLWLFALAADAAWWWTVIGPVAITVMFMAASIPMMEKRSLANRAAYATYAAEVSLIIPRPARNR